MLAPRRFWVAGTKEYLAVGEDLIQSQCIIVYSYRLLLHPLRSYPGPFLAKISDWYGAYNAYRRRIPTITYRDHLTYGPVVRHGPNKLVFNSIQAMRDILQNERLFKSSAYLVTQASPTTFNLFNVMDKHLHRTRRRMIGQGLTEGAVHRFEPVFQDHIVVFLQHHLEASLQDHAVDMSQRCGWLTMDVSGELGFGRGFGLQTDPSSRYVSMMNRRINVYLQFPAIKHTGWEKLLLLILLPKVRRFHRFLSGLIQSRVSQDKNARPDLFSSVSEYKDPETGKGLTRTEIWSEAAFLIPAGGDTVASLLSGVFFYLSRYPRVYERLAAEIRATFVGAEDIKHGPKLSGCNYLRGCLDESLRISPPTGTTLWRDLPLDANANPVIVDGHVIPPGTSLGVNIYAVHHNEAYFASPFDYKPERWLPDESGLTDEQTATMHSAFMAFSKGSRNCAGTAFAYTEASLVVAKTLWYFDFEKYGEDAASAESGRPAVFHMDDQVGSSHAGPMLVFRRRGDAWKVLESQHGPGGL
ncbi:cytochrome P450 [Lophiostoma macrostomum CBS 122681]|uniref:Cytochrome P450 n=1 Tax=Lophiostoma macrostomum CBS 122681 TaxID=1314788 RepID=A0A6A6SZF6_9PLEO|nr:cytochrome P450 [Lophiostoma macrostomum CBS 122681]